MGARRRWICVSIVRKGTSALLLLFCSLGFYLEIGSKRDSMTRYVFAQSNTESFEIMSWKLYLASFRDKLFSAFSFSVPTIAGKEM